MKTDESVRIEEAKEVQCLADLPAEIVKCPKTLEEYLNAAVENGDIRPHTALKLYCEANSISIDAMAVWVAFEDRCRATLEKMGVAVDDDTLDEYMLAMVGIGQ